MGRLEGKVAIITGAARGIGAAAARLFAGEGASLMLADVLTEPLREVAEDIGDRAAYSVTDVVDEASVRKLVEDTVARCGRIDVALLNAGIEGQVKPIGEYGTRIRPSTGCWGTRRKRSLAPRALSCCIRKIATR